MRAPAAAMQTTLAGAALRLVRLVELRLVQATYRYALGSAATVSFGGQSYSPTAGAYNEWRETTERRGPSFDLRLQNLDGVLGALCDPTVSTGRDQRGRRVVIRTVTEADIADADAVLTDTFFVNAVAVTRVLVSFALGNSPAQMVSVPSFVTQPYLCVWARTAYKGAECGSRSSEASCGGTLSDCRKRFGPREALRFGGFPLGRAASRRVTL